MGLEDDPVFSRANLLLVSRSVLSLFFELGDQTTKRLPLEEPQVFIAPGFGASNPMCFFVLLLAMIA